MSRGAVRRAWTRCWRRVLVDAGRLPAPTSTWARRRRTCCPGWPSGSGCARTRTATSTQRAGAAGRAASEPHGGGRAPPAALEAAHGEAGRGARGGIESGAGWSEQPGGELPGEPGPALVVVVRPPRSEVVDLDRLDALVDALKPGARDAPGAGGGARSRSEGRSDPRPSPHGARAPGRAAGSRPSSARCPCVPRCDTAAALRPRPLLERGQQRQDGSW